MPGDDIFQERYIDHQSRKKAEINGEDKGDEIKEPSKSFLEIISSRRSQRIFNENPLTDIELYFIYEAARLSPSSCNRQAVYMMEVDKDYAEEVLVGGRGWIKKSDRVFFLYASRLAYKSPNELPFMPFLDAGCVAQSIYLMCEYLGVGCCFVNPNMGAKKYEGEDFFCGAVALGHYDRKAKKRPKRKFMDVKTCT